MMSTDYFQSVRMPFTGSQLETGQKDRRIDGVKNTNHNDIQISILFDQQQQQQQHTSTVRNHNIYMHDLSVFLSQLSQPPE